MSTPLGQDAGEHPLSQGPGDRPATLADLFVEEARCPQPAEDPAPWPIARHPVTGLPVLLALEGLEAVAPGDVDSARADGLRPVTRLQMQLEALGFLRRPEQTGRFGPRTRRALADFQRAQNLAPADGTLNAETVAALQDPRPQVAVWAQDVWRACAERLGRPVNAPHRDEESGGLRQDCDGGFMLRLNGRTWARDLEGAELCSPLEPRPTPVTPAQGAVATAAPRWRQADPRWADAPLDLEHTLEEAGGGLVCVAMAVSALRLSHGQAPVHPDTLRGWLGGELPHRAPPGDAVAWVTETVHDRQPFSLDGLNAWLDEPPHAPVVVRVKRKVGGEDRDVHWLLVVASGWDANGTAWYEAVDPAQAAAPNSEEAARVRLHPEGDALVGDAGFTYRGKPVTYRAEPEEEPGLDRYLALGESGTLSRS